MAGTIGDGLIGSGLIGNSVVTITGPVLPLEDPRGSALDLSDPGQGAALSDAGRALRVSDQRNLTQRLTDPNGPTVSL